MSTTTEKKNGLRLYLMCCIVTVHVGAGVVSGSWLLFLSFGGSGPSYSCFPPKFLFKGSEVFLRTILSYLVKDLALENFVFPHIFGDHQKY